MSRLHSAEVRHATPSGATAPAPDSAMLGSLTGIDVVDLSWGRAGPFATGQLADHGASVIRVEPVGGDPFRPMVARAAYDRGKRSIEVDLTSAAGRAVVDRLLARADVLVTSWTPGVAERLGLGWSSLHQRYPRLVMCSISGYGVDDPARDRPGYESLVSARSGIMATPASDGRPVYPGVPIASIGAGLLSVIGIVAALLEREDTGLGQRVETSLYDGVLAFMNMFWEELEHLPDPVDAPARLAPRRLFVGTVRCGDGEYLGVHTGASGSHGRLMEALGLSDRVRPVDGPREKAVPLTDEEYAVVTTEVPRIFASRPRAHWLEQLEAYDVCAIPVLRQGEALVQPQVLHNEATVRLDDPEVGPVTQLGVAARLIAAPGAVRGPAPRVGEHTLDVLAELGLREGRSC